MAVFKYSFSCVSNLSRPIFLNKWLKSEILDLSHYQNFYEFPKFRIKLLILILLHFNIVRIIY